MKTKTTLLLTLFCLSCFIVNGQTKPTLGPTPDDTLIVNSGANFIIIPNAGDGESGTGIQDVTITATSSNSAIVQVNSVIFNDTSTMAVINVTAKDLVGTADIYIDATDVDGSTKDTLKVSVLPYSKPGIHFQIHDVVFWQEYVPLTNTPAFDTVIQSGLAPYASINWDNINLAVSAGCTTFPPCVGDDFLTALFIGYIVPPTTGDYYFIMKHQDDGAIWISENDDITKAKPVVYNGDKSTVVGTDIGSMEYKSAAVPLTAGKVYAFYATQWCVHTRIGGVLWEGPSIAKQYIPGTNMLYIYDPVRPTTPAGLKTLSRGVTDLRFGWKPSTDDKKLLGYNIYFDGVKINSSPHNDTIYHITGLTAQSVHTVAIAALDAMGNESTLSNIINVQTYNTDGNPPTPPTSINVVTKSDMALKISWSGATDAETSVKGYQVFVDGVLYNTLDYIYETSATITGLDPETSYSITVKSVDAGDNFSVESTPLVVKTLAFDPSNPSLGVKRGRVSIVMENIAWNEGMGIMSDHSTGAIITDAAQKAAAEGLKPSAVIWGSLDVNPQSLSERSGTGKPNTYARFMDFCNDMGAYTIITTGIKNTTDWRTDSTTFDKLMEYLNGPSSTPMGTLRAAEGFTAPLLANSKGLVIFIGCEVWGGVSHSAEIGANYDNYAKWARMAALRIKNSPYYDSKKVFVGVSGRNPEWAYSLKLNDKLLIGDKGEIDWLTISGYMGGNMAYDPAINPGDSELDYFKNGYESMMKNIAGLKTHMSYMFEYCGRLMTTNFYESNMTTPAFNGRVGQAMTITDYHATAVETGLALPCLFHLKGGEWRITEPENGYKKLPLYVTAQFVNTYCKGNVLKTTLTTTETISNSAGKALALDPVSCHAYNVDNKFSILLLSRDFANDYQLQIDLPDTLTVNPSGKKYIITGPGYSSKDYTIDSSNITLSDSLLVTVPKYGMVLITFSGSNPNFKQLPLGYYHYKKVESIEIMPKNGKTSIDKKYDYIDLLAKITPSDAMSEFMFKYKWEVVENSSKALTNRMDTSFQVRDLGSAKPATGTTTIRVSSFDNAGIKDEIVIPFNYVDLAKNTQGNVFVYPNPAFDKINIIATDDVSINISISDLTGKQVKNIRSAGNLSQIDISDIPSGLYLIRVDGDQSGISILKIIKQ